MHARRAADCVCRLVACAGWLCVNMCEQVDCVCRPVVTLCVQAGVRADCVCRLGVRAPAWLIQLISVLLVYCSIELSQPLYFKFNANFNTALEL